MTSPDEYCITLNIPSLDDSDCPCLYLENSRGDVASAYVYMDEGGEVSIGTTFSYDGTPEAQWNGRTQYWAVPCRVKSSVLLDLLQSEEAMNLLETVYLGHDVFWNGHNHVGRLDSEAQEAYDELQQLFNELDNTDSCALVLDCATWLGNCGVDEVWEKEKSVGAAANELRAATKRDGVWLCDDEVLEATLLDKLLDAYDCDEKMAPSDIQRASFASYDQAERLAELDEEYAEFAARLDAASE